jgi:hypothetical protein
MNVIVLKIVFNPENNNFQVIVEINQIQHNFNLNIETDLLNNQPLQIIQGDEKFQELFQWNRELGQKIYEMVSQVYKQENLDLPINLEDLELSPEPALNY